LKPVPPGLSRQVPEQASQGHAGAHLALHTSWGVFDDVPHTF
jgi:hypothetical protein